MDRHPGGFQSTNRSGIGVDTMEIKVRDLMNKQPPTIDADASVDRAVVELMNHKVPDLYVTTTHGNLVGVIPEYELLKLFLNGNNKGTKVADVMSGNLTTIRATYGIMQVAPLFRNSYLQRLAVVDEGKLIGELHRRDVIWLLATVDRILDGEQLLDVAPANNFERVPDASVDEDRIEQSLREANVPRPRFMRQQMGVGSRERSRAGANQRFDQ